MKCVAIDNASTDNTKDLLKKEYPTIELIENSRNLGFGAANNIGLRKAIDEGYDFVYLLNQDAWIEHQDILKLVEIAKENPDYGIISPMQVYADKKKIDKNFSKSIPGEMKDDFLLSENHPRKLYRVAGRTIQAAHWLVRVSALNKVGGFSPTFFHYGEDTNLCRRMEYHGYNLGIVPSILGIHNRENRKNTSQYLYLTRKNELKQILSNPNFSRKEIYKNLWKKMFNSFIDYKIKFFSILFDYIKSYPQNRKNRKLSINQPTAFLK